MDYTYTYYDASDAVAGGLLATLGAIVFIPIIIGLAVSIVSIIAMWKVFKKAGKNGWEAIVPVYNIITLLQIVGINPIWVLGLAVPVLNLIIAIAVAMRLAQGFGKDTSFTVGLILLNVVFMSILGFGKDTWDASRINKKSFSFLNDNNASTTSEAPTATPTTSEALTTPVAPETPFSPVAAPETPAAPAAPAAPETPASAAPETPTNPSNPTQTL